MEIFLINETDINLSHAPKAVPYMLIIQLRMIFCIFHSHIEWILYPLFRHIDTSAFTIASSRYAGSITFTKWSIMIKPCKSVKFRQKWRHKSIINWNQSNINRDKSSFWIIVGLCFITSSGRVYGNYHPFPLWVPIPTVI